MNRLKYIIAWVSLLPLSCGTKKDFTLFELQKPFKTGIEFNNAIAETEYFNIFLWEQMYNGGGVGLGDFNNDGLLDIFFSGNLVSNRLYLNQGGFRFSDVTEKSGLKTENKWCTGVALVDINGDGLLDIYTGASFYDSEGKRSNLLYINQGISDDGIPAFRDETVKYGIGDTGHTAAVLFFDYDNDNDLDLYILRNQLDILSANKYRKKLNGGASKSNDRLYQNNGNGSFKDVTVQAGILYEGYGSGINVTDINNDGWIDIYVTNDYLTNDVLYINNGNGTFTNQIARYLKHQSHYARGNDISDINNDGLQDIFEVDMLPADNQGQKKMIRESKFSDYMNNEQLGYEYQYQRNMLYLNNGTSLNGDHVFSEIGFYSGVYASGWSWGPLMADFDNDCYVDIFISNGFPKNIADMDFGMLSTQYSEAWDKKKLLAAIPELNTTNTAVHMVLTGAVGVACYKLVKNRAVRERPYITHSAIERGSVPLDRYSFPSGHTLHAISFTLLLAGYFPEWTSPLAALALLIALSRVILGLHYPTDVAAGAVVGGALGMGSLLLGQAWLS